MTAKELAERLNRREIGKEITRNEERMAKNAGLVVVFGYSDDCIEFRGAIDAEEGCFDGGTFLVAKAGVHDADERTDKTVEAVWCKDNDSPAWTYETEIPHETFEIMEDGEVWCRGIVFSVEDL